ncbi:MBL fold metallo-hydrolase [Candidatus Bathyarchaeota archaeon]|nr:MBL fold metallo-hydrolase [Candidatus Bathyarchaeota archaeon]
MVKIEILNGSNSIGGNFVRIEDGDKTLIFDQGIRFDIMSRYYKGFIMPQGITELRDLGILPRPEWYSGVSDIYITHMHLDHLGALSNIPGEDIVHIPSISIYEDLEERCRGSPTWLALIPRKYYVNLVEESSFEVDKNDVMPVPVSHSAHPAYALLYFGSDETVLYTGDFRIDSFLSPEDFQKVKGGGHLLEYLQENEDIKIDTLIIEATNFGSSRPPISPGDASKIIRRILSNNTFTIATLHGLDLEYAYFLLQVSAEFNLNCYLATSQTTKSLEKFSKLPLRPKIIEEYVPYITLFEVTALSDIEKPALILSSYRDVISLLRDLKMSNEQILTEAVAITSEPEPQKEEALEYGVIANWFSRMGVQHYRIRASGHYYPYEIKNILTRIKPKKIIPIHTENSRLFFEIVNRL